MKPIVSAKNRNLAALAASVLALALLSPGARAAATTLFWDGNGLTNSNAGGPGTWDLTTSNWRTTANGGGSTSTYTPNTAPSTMTATFAGTAGTVTLAGSTTINVNTITISTTGYIINGVAGSEIDLSAGTGAANSPPQITAPNTAGQTGTVNAVLGGSVGLSKGGSGTLVLGGANTYTGNTTIRGGILSISTIGTTGSTSSNLGAGTSTINFGVSGNPSATLVYTGSGETTDRVLNLAANSGGNGSGTIENDGSAALNFTSNLTTTNGGAKTWNFQGSNGGTISGNIVNGGATSLSLVKAGTGTWTLSGANTYSGGTTVSGGNLRLLSGVGGTTSSATGTGPVAVSGGTTTTVSGTGAALGLVTVTNGSHLAPGVNTSGVNNNFGSAGTLSLGMASTSSGLNLMSANLDFDLSASHSGSNDRIITTALTLGTLNFNLNGAGNSLETGQYYDLIGDTSLTAGYNLNSITTSFMGFNGAYTAQYSIGNPNAVNSTDLYVEFTAQAAPEPSTWVMMLGGLGSLLFIQSRRRRA